MIYTVLDPAKSMNGPSNPRSRGRADSPRVSRDGLLDGTDDGPAYVLFACSAPLL
jgi:hypothetical protein